MSHLNGVYSATPLNTVDISQDALNITHKVRSNPLRWSGQFSPQLVQVLLSNYATPHSVIFDPFLGSGTVLLEAGINGLSASGTEINPAAVTLARTYGMINVPLKLRRLHLNRVSKLLQDHFLDSLPLFGGTVGYSKAKTPTEIKSALIELSHSVEEELQSQLIKTLIVLLDFSKSDLSRDKLFKSWAKLSQLVTRFPFSRQNLNIFHADARRTPFPDSSVDLVITSPPYINVFNYHQQYRSSMEALSWDVLRVAKSEIGSNRKHRGNRFLTVIQFCLDIAQTLNEIVRVCISSGRVIFVVGRESKVLRTTFFNGEMVTEIAHRALGFDLMLRQERVFKNRFGQHIFEDILHFSPPSNGACPQDFLTIARQIAQEVLQGASAEVPPQSKKAISDALSKIIKIKPSPLFELSRCSHLEGEVGRKENEL